MMAAGSLAKTTIAFVYSDEVFVRRNRLREKLTSRGFAIKKEYAASSRAFDFSPVDLVVAHVEGAQNRSATVTAIEAAAERASVPIVVIGHQITGRGWEQLDAYATIQSSDAAPRPESAECVDAEATQIYSLLEQERDEARSRVQTLTGELGNVRADRERLTKEAADLRGKVTRLETDLEQTKLSSGETQEQRAAWTERLRTLEADRDASIAQNRKLITELTAAREHADRLDSVTGQADGLRAELERVRAERKDYCDRYKAANAREGKAQLRIADLEKQVAVRGEPRLLKDVRDQLAAANETIAELRSDLSEALDLVDVARKGRDVQTIADALLGVVKLGLMSPEEAFQKLVEAAK